jgi:hypothetical protein
MREVAAQWRQLAAMAEARDANPRDEVKRCERRSWPNGAQRGESTPGISAAWDRLGGAVARVLELRLRNQSV